MFPERRIKKRFIRLRLLEDHRLIMTRKLSKIV